MYPISQSIALKEDTEEFIGEDSGSLQEEKLSMGAGVDESLLLCKLPDFEDYGLYVCLKGKYRGFSCARSSLCILH
jgi:hypothetical protein